MKLMIFFISCWVLSSCVQNEENSQINPKDWSINHSVDFNREIHQREELAIKIYLAHHKDLKMNNTGSGLRYQLAKNRKGYGTKARIGDQVSVDLEIKLLNGRLCYKTDSIPDQFVLGMSNEESGLHEALQLMEENEKARLIVPSYLAHGLLGDSKEIPPQSILLIDVELLSLNK
tara:strand:- start:3093 stop:3617 length:525 start_codon:yes stop_codon:yes gene_type:complete